VRIFGPDESRLGLLPVQRRRSTVSGVKPVGLVPDPLESCYVYGAGEPVTGESFCLEVPQLHPVTFQIFLNEFTPHDPETLKIVLMDNGSCHTAKSLVLPEHLVCRFLPPYSPERNPIERLWQEVKQQVAWVWASAIDASEHHVDRLINHYSNAAIRSLTSYPYFVQAVHALCS
jgi:transposase